METNKLPEAVNDLKKRLKKEVQEFNKDTGLNLTGVIMEADGVRHTKEGKTLVSGYTVGVNIEL